MFEPRLPRLPSSETFGQIILPVPGIGPDQRNRNAGFDLKIFPARCWPDYASSSIRDDCNVFNSWLYFRKGLIHHSIVSLIECRLRYR
jgi:hypothetical protein